MAYYYSVLGQLETCIDTGGQHGLHAWAICEGTAR